MIDLNEIKSVRQAELEILHPVTGKGTGAFITLASPDHPARRKAVADASRRLREEGEKGGPELLDELTEESVIGSVLGWRGLRENGAEIVFTPEAARSLLKRPELYWLVRQLTNRLGEQENFIVTSAPG